MRDRVNAEAVCIYVRNLPDMKFLKIRKLENET